MHAFGSISERWDGHVDKRWPDASSKWHRDRSALPITPCLDSWCRGDRRLVRKVNSLIRLRPAPDFRSCERACVCNPSPAMIDGVHVFCGNCRGHARFPLLSNTRRRERRWGVAFLPGASCVRKLEAVVAAEAGSVLAPSSFVCRTCCSLGRRFLLGPT